MALRAFAVYHRSWHRLHGIRQWVDIHMFLRRLHRVTRIAVLSAVHAIPAWNHDVQCLFKVADERPLG
jgi:hypothetical protein